MADTKKKDVAEKGTHDAVPVEQGSDWAGDAEYRDLPADRKPSPSTIAQEQILPGDARS